MRKPHLYLDQLLQEGQNIILPASTARHVARVLRMRPGQDLSLFNNTGIEYDARILNIDNKNEIMI